MAVNTPPPGLEDPQILFHYLLQLAQELEELRQQIKKLQQEQQ